MNPKILISLLLILGSVGFLLLGGTRSSPSTPAGLGPRELIAQGGLLLDVRTPGEYQGGHLDGAVNIPVDQLERRLTEIGPKTRPVVVYCASGTRSFGAAKILKRSGFTTVLDIGSMRGWPGD